MTTQITLSDFFEEPQEGFLVAVWIVFGSIKDSGLWYNNRQHRGGRETWRHEERERKSIRVPTFFLL